MDSVKKNITLEVFPVKFRGIIGLAMNTVSGNAFLEVFIFPKGLTDAQRTTFSDKLLGHPVTDCPVVYHDVPFDQCERLFVNEATQENWIRFSNAAHRIHGHYPWREYNHPQISIRNDFFCELIGSGAIVHFAIMEEKSKYERVIEQHYLLDGLGIHIWDDILEEQRDVEMFGAGFIIDSPSPKVRWGMAGIGYVIWEENNNLVTFREKR